MCRKNDTLAKSKNGIVQWCYGCMSFHIGFGTFHISLSREQLNFLKGEMDYQVEDKLGKVTENEKFFFFTTESEFVKLAFTTNEIIEFQSLLSDSLWMYNALSLIGEGEEQE